MSRLSERTYEKRALSRSSQSRPHSTQSSTRATQAARQKLLSKTSTKRCASSRSHVASDRDLLSLCGSRSDTKERVDTWNAYAKHYVDEEYPLGTFESRDKWQDHVNSVIDDENFLLLAEKSIPDEEQQWRKAKHDPYAEEKRMGIIRSRMKAETRVKPFSDKKNIDEDDEEEVMKMDKMEGESRHNGGAQHNMLPRLPGTLEEEEEDDDVDDNGTSNEEESDDDEEDEEESDDEEEDEEEEGHKQTTEPVDVGSLIADILTDGRQASQQPTKEKENESIQDVDAAIAELLNERKEKEEEDKETSSNDEIDDIDAFLDKMEEEEEDSSEEEEDADKSELNIIREEENLPKEDDKCIEENAKEVEKKEEERQKVITADKTEDKTSEVENNDNTPPSKPSGKGKHDRRKKLVDVTLDESVLNELEGKIIEENAKEEEKKEEERQKLDDLIKELDLG